MKPNRILSTFLTTAGWVCFSLGGTASAQEPDSTSGNAVVAKPTADKKRVLLVRLADCCVASSRSAAEARIRKELSLSNLTVAVVEGPPQQHGSMQSRLDSLLSRTTAAGAVSITVSPSEGVFLHTLFYNRESKVFEYHRHFLIRRPAPDAVEIAALKTREAVLAVLYESDLRVPPETGNPPGATDQASIRPLPETNIGEPSAARKRLRLTGAFGGAWSPRGVGILGIVGGDLSIRLPWAPTVGSPSPLEQSSLLSARPPFDSHPAA